MKVISKKNIDEILQAPTSVTNQSKDQAINKAEISYDKYFLSSWQRIFFARLLDIILVSIIPLVLTITEKSWDQDQTWWKLLLMVSIAFICFLGYFIILPFWWKGKTPGRWLLRIKLVAMDGRISFWAIVVREMLIIFLPWICQIITSISLYEIFNLSFVELMSHPNSETVATILMKLMVTFYFFWYLGLFFGIIFSKNHQILFDNHFQLLFVSSKMIVVNNTSDKKLQSLLITRDNNHVHLGKNQPGNISEETLAEVEQL